MGKFFSAPLLHFRHRLRQNLNEEAGATLVYVTLVLPLFIGLAGLAIDGSNLYLQQRRMQSTADATALAATRLLALGQTTAQVNNEVNSLALTNSADTVSWNLRSNNQGIQVQTMHTFPSYFTGFLGHSTFTVQATASANFMAVDGIGNLLPMITKCDDMANDADPAFTYGATYTLWDHEKDAPGNFGWLKWHEHNNGASDLADNIAHPGNSGVWHVGDWVPGLTGTKSSSSVREALDGWIGKAVTIPLYSTVTGNGSNTKYQICAFAQFILTGYNFSGKDKWVQGTFVRSLVYGGESMGNAPDFGLRSIQFVQ